MSGPASLVRAAATLVLGVALRLSGRRAGVALVYHALAERNGDRERELVPAHAVELVEHQLRHLLARYRVVRAEELLEAVRTRRRGARFPVAVTFDDDLASHVEHALPLLRRTGVPATFFLCGASLERPFSFWWQDLQRAIDLGGPVPAAGSGIHDRAARIEAMTAGERAAVAERLRAEAGQVLGEAGLRAAQVAKLASAGFDIGFHTRRHDRLTGLDDAALEAALTDGRADLEAVVGRPLTVIAYPHGRADERVAEAAGAVGFALGFTGRYEPVTAPSPPLLLGRIEPVFGSVGAFALQLVRALAMRAHR